MEMIILMLLGSYSSAWAMMPYSPLLDVERADVWVDASLPGVEHCPAYAPTMTMVRRGRHSHDAAGLSGPEYPGRLSPRLLGEVFLCYKSSIYDELFRTA